MRCRSIARSLSRGDRDAAASNQRRRCGSPWRVTASGLAPRVVESPPCPIRSAGLRHHVAATPGPALPVIPQERRLAR